MIALPWVDVGTQVGAQRYLLVSLALVWILVTARWGLRPGLLPGAIFACAGMGFWVVGLARPYGLFVDDEITRFLADLAVGAATPALGEGAIAGEPPSSPGVRYWLWLGLSPAAYRWLPSVLPLFVALAPALLTAALWRDRAAPLAAALCLVASTGELDMLAGVGFLSGLWARPGASVLLVALFTAALLADGVLPARLRVPACTAIAAAWILVPGPSDPRGLGTILLLLTFDQGLWLWPAAWGLGWGGTALPRALCAAGATLCLLAGFGAPVETWGAHALYRLGLLLAAARALDSALAALTPHLASSLLAPGSGRPRLLARLFPDAASRAAGLLLLCVAPASFLIQWNARRHDATYEASTVPVSGAVAAAMEWIRGHTDKEATFVAASSYARAIAVLGERRLLRAPGFATPRGDRGRTRAEGGILHGRDVLEWARQYRVRYVFVTPGDYAQRDIERPEDVAGRGGLRLLFENAEGMRVYELPSP